MSKFRKPSTKKLGVKVLLLGEKGVGKSVFSLSFPKVAALDAETGMAFYENHPVFGKNLVGIANTQDFNELSESIDEIMEGAESGEIKTMVIDSETKFYQNLTDAALTVEEKKARKAGKDIMDSAVSMRGWGRIKSVAQRLQNAKIDLSAKGINVISIAQIDDIKQKQGDTFVKIGEKPVMQKGSEYDYDIVVKLFTEKDPRSGDVTYKGEILKDRTTVYKIGQIVDNPSYENWRLFLESREGAEMIDSKLAGDSAKSQKTLQDEDAKAEKPVTDKLKEVMAKSDTHRAKALEAINKAGIKNPLAPKDAKEMETLNKIVDALEGLEVPA